MIAGSGDSGIRAFLEKEPVPRAVPETWVRALSPRPSARWLSRMMWLFPALMGLFLMGTAKWEPRQFARALIDFRQAVLPAPDMRSVEATIIAVETHTSRKLDTDFMSAVYTFTAADGSVHFGKGYFIERDLPPAGRITVRHLDNNPAIAFPEGGSYGLPGFLGAIGVWIVLVVATALARPLIHAADRAEVRRILREGALHGDQVALGGGSRVITVAGLHRAVDKLPESTKP